MVTTAHAMQCAGKTVQRGSALPATIPATANKADTSPNQTHSVKCRRAFTQPYTVPAVLGRSAIHH